MVYPESMQKSLGLVEKTRPKRVGKAMERIGLEEKSQILQKFHPDYKKEAKRALIIGPNHGDIVPNEVADLLESNPLIQPNDIDLSKIDFDVDILVIGGGGAGMVAALWAHQSGIKPEDMLIVQKLRLGDSNSKMSQGGIQAADGADDSPAMHYIDVIGGGHFANKPELVRALVNDGPFIINWHESMGIMYDKNPDGSMILRSGGGTCRRRMHSAKDYTGLEIVRVFMDEIKNIGIPVVEFTSVVELVKDEFGSVAGAVLYNMETGEYSVVRAKSTVLATGGFGRLHIQSFPTTNHYGATCDGVVLAYRTGAAIRDMDSVQYHPTGAAYPEQLLGQLCTEELRSMGAQPVNKHGELFVHPLEPRDLEAAAFIRECYGRDNGVETLTKMRGVWLDTPMIEIVHGDGAIKKNLAAMWRMFNRFDIDITKEPILVFPTLHYQNGGVEINERTETNVPGLFAAGEVGGGVHGKNRLMGNSILGYNVFGRRAGIYAAEHAKKAKLGRLTLSHVTAYQKMLEKDGMITKRRSPILLPEYRGEKVLSHMLGIL